ncbi:MAG: exo-alpha-sialidase, partial [Planctomycetaceae bacterium]|nr:exo-alpha-sialidase [Planctomycetaceae bacterium]
MKSWLLAFSVWCLWAGMAVAQLPDIVDVFVGGQDGYFAYRIPSLITTKSG